MRYEDLVDDTDKTLENIYSHIGLPWTEHVRFLQSMLKFKPKFQSSPFAKTIIFFVARKVIWSHTHAENVTGTNGHGYYNTFRWQGITKKEDQIKTYETPFILPLTLAKKKVPYICDDNYRD